MKEKAGISEYTTSGGFTCRLNAKDLEDDMEFFELVTQFDGGSPLALPPMVNIMFPDPEEKKRLYDACRGENGRVSATAVATTIKELFHAIGEAKKGDPLKN